MASVTSRADRTVGVQPRRHIVTWILACESRRSTIPARSSVPTGESEALCVGQASSTLSARTMMASRAMEMAAPRVI
jgi:hypothetical protein